MQCLDCLCVHETFAKRGVADVAGEKGGDCLPFLTRGLCGTIITYILLDFHLQSQDGQQGFLCAKGTGLDRDIAEHGRGFVTSIETQQGPGF